MKSTTVEAGDHSLRRLGRWVTPVKPMEKVFGPAVFDPRYCIYESIVDINSTVQSHFAIVDGIVGMEGNGPRQGMPKPVGVLVFGENLVAVDATCARVAGLNPEKIELSARCG